MSARLSASTPATCPQHLPSADPVPGPSVPATVWSETAVHLTTTRWILEHLRAQRGLLAVFAVGAVASNLAATFVPLYTGRAFAVVTGHNAGPRDLAVVMLSVVGLVMGRFVAEAASIGAVETVAQRVKRDKIGRGSCR